MGFLLASLVISSSVNNVSAVEFGTTCDEPNYFYFGQPEGWDAKYSVKYAAWSGDKAKGNPGSFYSMKGSWDKGRVGLHGAMGQQAWAFDPQQDKVIDSIEFTTDIRIHNPSRQAALSLQQGDHGYVAYIKPKDKNSTDWQTVTAKFKANDFRELGFESLYSSSGPNLAIYKSGHPNFKKGGGYCSFLVGFFQIDKNALAGNDSIDYDNIKIKVNYKTVD